MTPDTIAIIGTGVAIVAVQVGLWAWLRSDIARLVDRVRVSSLEVRLSGLEADLRERMARFEGFIRREPPAPGADTA